MKTLSKILSIALVLSMLLGFALVGRAAETPLATFTFPTSDKTTEWQDGSDLSSGTTFTAGSYSLKFTDCTKVYQKGNDSAGTGFIKFGTSSKVGTLTFTVPNEVTKVELHLAKYKNNTSYYTINSGAATAISKATPQYDVVSVDTSSNKTITLASASSGKRMVLLSVLYYGAGSGPVHTCEWKATADSCVAKDHLKHTSTFSCKDATCTKKNPVEAPHDYDANGKCPTCGYEFKVQGTLTIPEALAKAEAAGSSYTSDFWQVTGKIKSVDNATYGNMYIEDANGNELYVYGLYMPYGGVRYDAMQNKPQVGDTITIATVLGTYNSSSSTTKQAKNAWLMKLVPSNCTHANVVDYICQVCNAPVGPEADKVLTFEEVKKIAEAFGGGSTPNKYYVEGTITEIYNTTYGNMKIKDASGKILTIYGSYDETGANRFDKMENPHGVGDKVKVYGAIGSYNGDPQILNGWVKVTERAPSNNNQNQNQNQNQNNNQNNTNNPKDGDIMSIASVVSTMVLSMGGVVALVIKRKNWTV